MCTHGLGGATSCGGHGEGARLSRVQDVFLPRGLTRSSDPPSVPFRSLLKLAWALTVHRSQGMVRPVLPSPRFPRFVLVVGFGVG